MFPSRSVPLTKVLSLHIVFFFLLHISRLFYHSILLPGLLSEISYPLFLFSYLLAYFNFLLMLRYYSSFNLPSRQPPSVRRSSFVCSVGLGQGNFARSTIVLLSPFSIPQSAIEADGHGHQTVDRI